MECPFQKATGRYLSRLVFFLASLTLSVEHSNAGPDTGRNPRVLSAVAVWMEQWKSGTDPQGYILLSHVPCPLHLCSENTISSMISSIHICAKCSKAPAGARHAGYTYGLSTDVHTELSLSKVSASERGAYN